MHPTRFTVGMNIMPNVSQKLLSIATRRNPDLEGCSAVYFARLVQETSHLYQTAVVYRLAPLPVTSISIPSRSHSAIEAARKDTALLC